MFEQVLAGAVLAVCAVLLLRLVVGAPRRYRFDMAVRRGWQACVRLVRQPGEQRKRQREAAAQAEELIRRVRRDVEREGNVIRPKQFRDSKLPRKPH